MWPVVVLLMMEFYYRTTDLRCKDCCSGKCVSTTEAQEGVALEIAEAVVEALKGELTTTAVNAPKVPAEKLLDCG
ncbi:hypothetical protein V6N13_126710 [Hibiscus sabdariffa]|uniref:Uncharacterized protein n=1 Tax=Hibiscus sabdariffa TaxID=183260 RepID=A0ABR2RF91_9ROSI